MKKQDLQNKLDFVNQFYGLDLSLEHNLGGYRVVAPAKKLGCLRDVSPRLSPKEMAAQLNAWIDIYWELHHKSEKLSRISVSEAIK